MIGITIEMMQKEMSINKIIIIPVTATQN